MDINWKVRLKNKSFWLAFVPAILLLVQTVLATFGLSFDFTALGNQIIAVVNAVFAVLSIMGVVADPTTPGIQDSARAMTYVEPGKAEQK